MIPTPLESSFQSRWRMPHFQTSGKDFSAPKIQFEIQILLNQCNDRSILGTRNGNFACKFQIFESGKNFLAVSGSNCQVLPHQNPTEPWISWRIPRRRKNHLSSLKVKFLSIWVPFPANPSQIPPTLCHGNKVKPWKSLENYQIYRSFDETEKERKKKAVFGRNSQKFTKSAKKKIGKRCSSQKSWNFIAGDERPGQLLRFEPQQAMLWQIWPKSPKKCQMRKFPKKNFFFKFQKRS